MSWCDLDLPGFLHQSLFGVCNIGSARVHSPAIYETYFSFHKDTRIAVNYYDIYFYLIVLVPLTTVLQLVNLSFIIKHPLKRERLLFSLLDFRQPLSHYRLA